LTLAALRGPENPNNNRNMSGSETPVNMSRSSLPLSLLAAAGFLSALGARIIDPLLAVLARDFATTVAAASILVAAFTLPYGLNQLLLGPLGDRFGKLRLLLAALGGYTLFMIACAGASNLPLLTVLRACAGACSAGLIPTCLAYIGDTVPYEQRQLAISRFLGGVLLAPALSGPLGGLFGEFIGWRGVFLLLGGLGLTVALLVAQRMRDLPDPRHNGVIFNRRNYATLLRHRPARLLLVVTVIEGMLLPGAFPFLAPYMTEHFGLSYGGAGLVLSAFGIGALGYSYLAPWLVRGLGESGLVLTGGVTIAGAMWLAFTLNAWPFFILLQVALGLGYFMLHSVMQARATELLPQARATAVSSFVFMLFLGQSLGALAMGAAIHLWGYRGAFQLVISGTILLTLWLFLYMRRSYALCSATSGD